VQYRKRQKFRGWKVSRFAGFIRYAGKSFVIFSSPFSNIHGFRTLQNSYERFNESFTFLTWILLKTVISILGNGREYITDTCVQISRFSGWPCSHRRRTTVEVSLSESQITNCFLVSFFCKSLLAETSAEIP